VSGALPVAVHTANSILIGNGPVVVVPPVLLLHLRGVCTGTLSTGHGGCQVSREMIDQGSTVILIII
jgi:hypothetical protein